MGSNIQQERNNLIKETTTKLFLEQGYALLTISKISDECGVHRNVIYKGYKNTADILLDYLGDWLDAQISYLLSSVEEELSPLYRIVGIIDLSSEIKCFAAIYTSVLEPAASETHLIKFRKKMKRFSEILGIISMEYDSELTMEEYRDFYESFLILFIGIASLNTNDPKIVKACHTIGEPWMEYGICELAIQFFAGTRNLELAIPYWTEVKEIVDNRKYSSQVNSVASIESDDIFGDDYEF